MSMKVDEWRVRELIREDRDQNSSGCLSVLLSLVFFVVFLAPALPLVNGFWREMACSYGLMTLGCDAPIVKFWREILR